jgi:hypothetical protein
MKLGAHSKTIEDLNKEVGGTFIAYCAYWCLSPHLYIFVVLRRIVCLAMDNAWRRI